MATQTLEFTAGTGLTLTCKLFAVGADTVVASASATEKTNDKNRYTVAFTDIPAGDYRLNAFVGAVGGFANEVYDLTLVTATFYPRSEQELSASAVPDVIVNITPAVVVQENTVSRNEIEIFTGESDDLTVYFYENDRVTPLDISGITPEFKISNKSDVLLYTIVAADINLGGSDNNTITFSKASITSDDFEGKYSLRDTSNGNKVLATGKLTVTYAP